MRKKPFFASKTMWINAIALLASVAGPLGLGFDLDAETQASLVGGIMAVVNIILRATTNAGVSLK